MSAIQIIKERAESALKAYESATTHGGRMGHLYSVNAYRDTLSLLSLYGNKEAEAAHEEIHRLYLNSSVYATPQPA